MCSLDQTTRAYATSDDNTSWREVSRPQIHGYDMIDIACLGDLRFASIGDEKVTRVFDAPRSFARTMQHLGKFGDINLVCSKSLNETDY